MTLTLGSAQNRAVTAERLFSRGVCPPVCFQELARERQENIRLLKAHQDKDDLIGKLKEEIDLLNRVSPAHVTSCSDDIFSVPFVLSCVGGERGCKPSSGILVACSSKMISLVWI